MLYAYNICKQFGPRSGPTKCHARSKSKLFDTLIVFLKDYFKKMILKKSADDKNMKNYPVGNELNTLAYCKGPTEIQKHNSMIYP